ncbi:DUF2141 domain-containing protein [Massilia glaciei]|uniref:DUF2141 domain-containing protein n=1 Tax=Massilia glaciei TaxID=1524097 RepID=A0A2U2HM83_9BURK|nr:DUF2141 domain-containing protein [Massilia glaciei]PWF48546.1 DUF2141 domain-containing protein [Massilia glaciei]
MNHSIHNIIRTIFCSAALATCGLASAADLTIHVDDVKSAAGNLMVAVYNAEGTFLKAAPAGVGGAPAAVGSNVVVIKNLPAGEYAFAVYHDANGNGKMDKNMIGIPTEDYGFSNNAMGKMGPPSYDAAKFALAEAGGTVRVSLK